MSDHAIGSLVEEHRVRTAVYTDASVFQQEIERIFGRTWIYVAHTSEIPNPHDYKTTTIGRTPVIVVRDDRGRVRVLLNRCRHRAATVCDEPCGTVARFRCPYHGWVYEVDG